MTRAFSRQGLVVCASAAFVVIAVGCLAALFYTGTLSASSQDRAGVEQPAVGSPQQSHATANAVAAENNSKEAGDKPPVGVCRETWIGDSQRPTYDCNVLFGPV
jgi:hypothetical protein